MSYYKNILKKYEISNCKTLNDVKRKFPDKSVAYLRKIIYLKGFEISKDGKLNKSVKNRNYGQKYHQSTLFQYTHKKRHLYSKVNCPQCGKEVFLVRPKDPFCSKKCKNEFKKFHGTYKKPKEKIVDGKLFEDNHCPECGSTNLERNSEDLTIICIDCGLLVRTQN